ncbi:MAG: STAS domain-containing protein [Myxococcota bacterium]
MPSLTKVGDRLIAAGSITSDSVDGFRELLHLLISNDACAEVIDLSGVEHIDLEGAQLLAEFVETRPDIRLERPSPTARELFGRIGIVVD